MKKLNICLVSLAIPPDRQDGEAKFFRGIFDYLRKKGHAVKLLTARWETDLRDPDIIQLSIIRKRFFWVPQFNLGAAKYLRSHHFDIIHGNGPKGTFPIVLSNQKRFISTIHDVGHFEAQFYKIPIMKFLIKYIAQKATYLTTCSDIIRKALNHYVPKANLNRIFNLYSAIEEKFKPYPKEAQKLKEKLNLQGPVLLYLGRIASYKGIDHIIAAYEIVKKEVPTLNLVIGGKPDYAMEKVYQEWKRKYKDSKNVRFVGFVSEEEIPYYYSMGEVFVTYSFASEGFGLTPIEAIACGTPVVCSSILAYREVLQDNALFVPPKNPKALAEAITKLLKNAPFKNELVQKAQQFIKRYSWDAVGEKLEQVYDKFVFNGKR